MINNNYINSLANLAPWNMTTVIRTHYLIKPHNQQHCLSQDRRKA